MRTRFFPILLPIAFSILLIAGCTGSSAPVTPGGNDVTDEISRVVEWTPGETVDVGLYNSLNNNVGTISITNDADQIYVTWNMNGDWLLDQTHMQMEDSMSDFPMDMQGMPMMDMYEYGHTHMMPQMVDSYMIDMSEVAGSDHVYFAIHADIHKEDGGIA